MDTGNEKMIYEMALGRSGVGTFCGAATVVLAILGLVNIMPVTLVAIATIVIGASLFVRGAVISSEYHKLLSHLSGSHADKVELGGGLSVEILTGCAVIVLGVLALIGMDHKVLVAIALIVAGCGVVLSCGVISRLNLLKLELSGSDRGSHHHKIAEEIVSTAMGVQFLAGAAAIVLGILSLLAIEPLTLNLVGLLSLGAATLISGSALAGKLLCMKHLF